MLMKEIWRAPQMNGRIKFLLLWIILPIVGGLLISLFRNSALPGIMGIPYLYIGTIILLYSASALTKSKAISEDNSKLVIDNFLLSLLILIIMWVVGAWTIVQSVLLTAPMPNLAAIVLVFWILKPIFAILGTFWDLMGAVSDAINYIMVFYGFLILIGLFFS